MLVEGHTISGVVLAVINSIKKGATSWQLLLSSYDMT